MHKFFSELKKSFIALITVLVIAYMWGSATAFLSVLILCALEISLSFDNAVVNAKVLAQMSRPWQDRFLTWGILVSVVGVRFILPIIIVSLASGSSFMSVLSLAFNDSVAYGEALSHAHVSISSFGSLFLFMVFLKYFVDETKNIHWIAVIEKHLARLGKLETIEVVIALLFLFVLIGSVPAHEGVTVAKSGLIGIISFVLIESIVGLFSGGKGYGLTAAHSSLFLFMYLQVLDSSFSLDGVIGAFAVSNDLIVIVLGLGIGAYFVKTMTLMLVHGGTLLKYRYLEHGAHYAIGALSLLMALSIFQHVSEKLTGLLGVCIIFAAFISSILYNKKLAKIVE